MGMLIFLFSVLLLLPLCIIKPDTKAATPTKAAVKTAVKEKKTDKVFRVLNKSDNTVTEYAVSDYIFGVVAAEMPALYEKEALKAQAVAAYTYALNKLNQNKDLNYDITNDFNVDQSFITVETAKERWGENADEYTEKIKTAINEVEGLAITYKSEPINAVYHAVSSGKTESCKDIWGKDLPYLQSVSSEDDKLAQNYISEAVFSSEEIKEKLGEQVDFKGECENWFKESERTIAGSVKFITVCDEKISGSKIRSALNLRSSNFDVKYSDGNFTFLTYGYGHGVGMSQNGANCMAKQGSDYKEILLHYYTNCKIKRIK